MIGCAYCTPVLGTTMMAGPLFEAVYGRKARESGELGAIHGEASPSTR